MTFAGTSARPRQVARQRARMTGRPVSGTLAVTDRRHVIYRLRRAMTHLMLWYDEREEKEREQKADEVVAEAIKVRRSIERLRGLRGYRNVHFPR